MDQLAKDPKSPIKWDPETNEFNIQGLCVYHCPFCGGAAPKSVRASLFFPVSNEERDRLASITDGIRSIEAALKNLGAPSHDYKSGSEVHFPETNGKPPLVMQYRTLVYTNLSDTVEVRIVDYPERAQVAFSGKYRGRTSK